MNQFLETFLKEWDLYQKQGGTPTIDDCRTSEHAGDFDKSVRAGEIRVFSDSNRQLVGLVYKSWGEDAWIVIPVSDFSVPATEQEILIGTRVYQLWNAFTASASFVEKSWLIDTLSSDDQQDICVALLHMTIGEPLREDLQSCLGETIISVDDPRLEYERTFVVDAERTVAAVMVVDEEPTRNRGFWLESVWNKYGLVEPDYALAAATDDLEPHIPVLLHKGAWDAMMEGREASGFSGYSSNGGGQSGLTFYLCGDIPHEFDGVDELSVVAYKRDTRELVGKGIMKRLDDGRCKISIRLGEGCESVDVQSAGELVLVAE